MAECPQKGDVSDLCPKGICQGYGPESQAGGSRLLDLCTLTQKCCDATKRDWDGPLSPYCWRYRADRAEAWEQMAGRLAEGLASCRDYLAALSRSGAVAGYEMEMPSYEVTEPLAAHEALKREMGGGEPGSDEARR